MDATANVARCRETGGWKSVAVNLHLRRDGARMEVQPGRLEPGEYLVILRNPDGSESL